MAVAILRLPKGLDYSHLNIEVSASFALNGNLTTHSSTSNLGQSSEHATGDLKAADASQLMHADSNLNLAGMISSNSTITVPQPRMLTSILIPKKKKLPFLSECVSELFM